MISMQSLRVVKNDSSWLQDNEPIPVSGADRMQADNFPYELAVLSPMDLDAFSFGDSETNSSQQSIATKHLTSEFCPIQDENTTSSSDIVTLHIPEDFPIGAVGNSGLLDSLSLLDSDISQFESFKNTNSSYSNSGILQYTDPSFCVSSSGKSEQTTSLDSHNILPTQPVSSEKPNLTTGPVIVPSEFKPIENDSLELFSYHHITPDIRSGVEVFPSDPEESSTHELQNMRTDMYFYQDASEGNSDNSRVLEQNVIPFQTVKVNEESVPLYQQVKSEFEDGTLTMMGDELLAAVQFPQQPVAQVEIQSSDTTVPYATEESKDFVVPVSAKDVQQQEKWSYVQQAVAAVRGGFMSSNGAARHFNLPKTTLRRHLLSYGVPKEKPEVRPPCMKWNAKVMEEAVAVVLAGRMSSTKAAKHYKVPRTTLRRYIETSSGIESPQAQPKRFPCTKCGRSFSKRSYLNSHMQQACT